MPPFAWKQTPPEVHTVAPELPTHAARCPDLHTGWQQRNVTAPLCVLQGFNGPTYSAAVALSTKMTLQSDSVACIEGQRCLPLGGYSVWAALPPFSAPEGDAAAPEREQIVVMSHWDSRSLFRYMAMVRLPLQASLGAATDALAGAAQRPDGVFLLRGSAVFLSVTASRRGRQKHGAVAAFH